MQPQKLTVSAEDSGHALQVILLRRLGLRWAQTRQLVGKGRILVDGVQCHDATKRLRQGQRVRVLPGEEQRKANRPTRSPDPTPVIRHADAHLVVVEKPPGLTTMRHAHEVAEFGPRGRRFLPPTLAELLPKLLGERGRLRAVHRLDKDTSGLVVFARTPAAERHLGKQFRAHSIRRTYLAVVRGRAQAGRIESYLVEDRGDGRRGSTTVPGEGKPAVTHVRVVEELGEYTLVECRLETGRTHQVRIHLGESGTPLCGERVYDRPPHGKPLPDGSLATRPMLHAASLGFEHPATGKQMTWTAALPADMKRLLERLRRWAREKAQ